LHYIAFLLAFAGLDYAERNFQADYFFGAFALTIYINEA